MLFTLLASIYISLVCWAWGRFFFRFFKKITGLTLVQPFSITCITGLSFIISILGILTFFIPLGGWLIQFLFLLPPIFIIASEYRISLKSTIINIFSLQSPVLFLLLVSILVVLVMSTWSIIHPDTLGYHAQLIQWSEKYRVIPGLANLNARYGLQSNWFLACALFSFKFTGSQALLYLNSALLLWFIIFIVNKINEFLAGNTRVWNGFLWILLFGFSFWSYTQVRLMATSASPDFLAAILIWTILYIFLSKKEQPEISYPDFFLIALLCGTAITIKFSSLPVLFITAVPLYFLFRQKKFKNMLMIGVIVIITVLPFLVRNIITSGYPLFPAVYGSFQVDWKLDETTTRQITDYVTVYSRTAFSYSNPFVKDVLLMSWTEWVPIWWKILSTADKTIILLLVASVLAGIAMIKKIFRADRKSIIALLVCLTGVIFWFTLAPDLRFGFGFIFGFIGITVSMIIRENTLVSLAVIKKNLMASVWMISLLLSVYVVYRFKNFYSSEQWLKPMGTEKVAYKTIICDGIKTNVQLSIRGCGDRVIPCAYDSCRNFQLRGTTIKKGFRAK